MSTVAISIDTKNPTEVLACYGILALDFLHDKRITRSRFVESLNVELGQDGEFRTGSFEFEHPDFQSFLSRCGDIKLSINDKEQVSIVLDGMNVLTLDWYNNRGLFVGDAGNFAQADKLLFVETHHQVLRTVVDKLQNYRDLFSTAKEDNSVTNYLSSYSSRKRDFLDEGGVYEPVSKLYVSEWFLLIALQVFRHFFEEYLIKSRKLRYSLFNDWLPTSGAFAALVGGHHSCKYYEASLISFGKGKVLRVAREVSL